MLAEIETRPSSAAPSVATVFAARRHALPAIRGQAAELDARGDFPAGDVALLARVDAPGGDERAPRFSAGAWRDDPLW